MLSSYAFMLINLGNQFQRICHNRCSWFDYYKWFMYFKPFISFKRIQYTLGIIIKRRLAYYAYLFIGMDMDTFSPMGGTQILHTVENIVNNAQTLTEPGWSAFKDTKNRHAIINDSREDLVLCCEVGSGVIPVSREERQAREVIKAGVDVLLCVREYPKVFDAVLNAVRRGEIPESRIDESVRRILKLRHRSITYGDKK